jgi:CxxC motif-containing protein (DUF1111 family)
LKLSFKINIDRVGVRGGLLAAALAVACGDGGAPAPALVTDDLSDEPLRGSSTAQLDAFAEGDALFEILFRDNDGVGPLFIRKSCGSCHAGAGKGPGSVHKMQVVDADGSPPAGTPPELPWGTTERPYVAGGGHTPVMAPAGLPDGRLRTSVRIGPSVLGRGYVEAVLDSEIERVAAAQALRSDGIRGRINRVSYHSEPVPGAALPHARGDADLIGRFGLKARIATLDDFTADAFQGDMGLTSPLRPVEVPNPDGLADDLKPGVDVDADVVLAVGRYARLLEIPRRPIDAAQDRGRALFDQAMCSACHVPTLRTRPDFPVPQLADIEAPIYSDLLLHDMGADLADALVEESAGPSEWRTAPLIGLRFQRSYLHDGRALTLEQAVRAHAGPGSQANVSVDRFQALSPGDQAALLDFVGRL